MQQVDKGKYLQGVDAVSVLRARSNLALHIEWRSAHGDFESVSHAGAEQ